ncbi:MAG: YlbF family regulator [Ruminococcaceae bacterium]|nr:YlbF family regulator [Oscillospiraceae bacterium]
MDIFEMATALGDALKQDEKLVALEAARKNYEADRQLQTLVIEYEVQQRAMQKEAVDPNCDTHMIDMIQNRINELYEAITQNETYLALERAQEEVNALMNKINGIITARITGQEPGCTHNCATCGGCH